MYKLLIIGMFLCLSCGCYSDVTWEIEMADGSSKTIQSYRVEHTDNGSIVFFRNGDNVIIPRGEWVNITAKADKVFKYDK